MVLKRRLLEQDTAQEFILDSDLQEQLSEDDNSPSTLQKTVDY
jgi:hypothetical protein